MSGSLIRERLDGILRGGAQAGIERAQQHACQADGAGDRPPSRRNGLRQGGRIQQLNEGARREAEPDSHDSAAQPHDHRFGQNNLQNKPARRAQRLQNSDLAGALQDGHVHGEQHHGESDHHADTDHHVDEGAQSADIFDGEQRSKFFHRVDVVIGQEHFQFRQDLGYIGGLVGFYEDLADPACISGKILQCPHGYDQVCELAAFRYAGHAPAVVEDVGHLVPGMQLVLPRVVFVDDDVVGTPERTAFQILEAAAHLVEASQIDTADEAHAGNVKHDHAYGQRHVGLLPNDIDQLFAHGSAAEGQHGGSGRPHHDVGADAAGAAGGIVQHAAADTHQTQNQRHGHGDQEYAQQAAHGLMLQVLQNESYRHGFFFFPFGAGAGAAGGVGAGWPST